ncbi:metal-dependent transcriptional regulator [Thermophagus sp. OGC60D27]|uniref:metal-dependent transcriptional regulator n=1 Tax=Thermophagus sp. OGC60D27 TaxID=3458415 RepID=UPI0040383F9F
MKTKENYLKAMYLIAQEGKSISLSLLSEKMGVSIPTVNSMVKRLHDLGLVTYKKYKPLQLTGKGKKAAGLILRKHRIAEMYLVEILGFSWEEVHEIAEEIEHIHSDKLFDRMDEALGFPDADPHGSPIPDKSGNIVLPNYFKLSDADVGQSVRLCAIQNSDTHLLKYLNRKELKLGIVIKIDHIEPFDKSMTVSYPEHANEVLSNDVCVRLLVEMS